MATEVWRSRYALYEVASDPGSRSCARDCDVCGFDFRARGRLVMAFGSIRYRHVPDAPDGVDRLVSEIGLARIAG